MGPEDEHNARVAAAFRYFQNNPGAGCLTGNVGDDGVTRWQCNGVEVDVPGSPMRVVPYRRPQSRGMWRAIVVAVLLGAFGAWSAWSRARHHDAVVAAAKRSAP